MLNAAQRIDRTEEVVSTVNCELGETEAMVTPGLELVLFFSYSFSALLFCACPLPPLSRLTSCALHTHTHLSPQHWLLFHLG